MKKQFQALQGRAAAQVRAAALVPEAFATRRPLQRPPHQENQVLRLQGQETVVVHLQEAHQILQKEKALQAEAIRQGIGQAHANKGKSN